MANNVSSNASVAYFDTDHEGVALPEGPGFYEVEGENPLELGKKVVADPGGDWFVYADSVEDASAEAAPADAGEVTNEDVSAAPEVSEEPPAEGGE